MHTHTIFLSKPTGFHECDFSACIQVLLVPNQDDDYIGASESPGISQPVSQCIVGLTAVKHAYANPTLIIITYIHDIVHECSFKFHMQFAVQ